MSAFVCSNYHYQAIARTFRYHFNRSRDNHIPTHYWSAAWGYGIQGERHINEFVQRIFSLNIKTFNAKYNETVPFEILPFHNDRKAPLDNIALYKALTCVLYQIEMEHITPSKQEAKDHDTLERIKNHIANIIVSRLPAYDTADWEIRTEENKMILIG